MMRQVAGRWPVFLALAFVVVGGACVAAGQAPAQVSAAERDQYATEARWAPGQLEAHFQKHPQGYRSVQEYDRGARDVVRQGTAFSYRDREAGETRLGFFERGSGRFTALTRDGRRITTHFRPDDGERYVLRLPQSTYR